METLRQQNEELQKELEEFRSQLSNQQQESLGDDIIKRNEKILELQKRNYELIQEVEKRRDKQAQLEKEIKSLRHSVQVARQQLAEARDATLGLELPEAADLLNQYKAMNPKTKVTLTEMKAILDLLPQNS